MQPHIDAADYRALGWSLTARDAIESRLDRLTRDAFAAGPADLVLWPETASGQVDAQTPRRMERIRALLHRTGASILTGTLVADNDELRNAAMLVSERGVETVTAKQNLVPFAESDMRPGVRELVAVKKLPVGVLLCFDAVFGREVRKLAVEGAQLLVVLTDDALLEPSFVTIVHLAQARLRAAEAGLGLVFASNGGPSVVISADGATLASLRRGAAATLRAEVPVVREFSPALAGTRHVVPWLCAVVCTLLWWRQHRPGVPDLAWNSRGRVALSVVASLLFGLSIGSATDLAVATLQNPELSAGGFASRAAAPDATDLRAAYAPAFRQSRRERCGAAAMALALTTLGDDVSEPELIQTCLHEGQVSLAGLQQCAQQRGYSARGFQLTWDDLAVVRPGVALLHLSAGHFVVMLRAGKHEALIFEPASGSLVTIDRSRLEPLWSGKALVVSYGPPGLRGQHVRGYAASGPTSRGTSP